jgi:hypothetical protein
MIKKPDLSSSATRRSATTFTYSATQLRGEILNILHLCLWILAISLRVTNIVVQALFRRFLGHDPRITIMSSLCSECSTAPHSGLAGAVVAHTLGRRVLRRNSNSKGRCFRGARGGLLAFLGRRAERRVGETRLTSPQTLVSRISVASPRALPILWARPHP